MYGGALLKVSLGIFSFLILPILIAPLNGQIIIIHNLKLILG